MPLFATSAKQIGKKMEVLMLEYPDGIPNQEPLNVKGISDQVLGDSDPPHGPYSNSLSCRCY